MKKILSICLAAALVAGSGLFVACDEEFDLPSIELSETEVTASPGEDVSVTIDLVTDAGFKNLIVTKLWDGVEQDEEVLTTKPTGPYVYTVTDEDADHITTLNFTVTDSKGKTAAMELVITVELTSLQVLLKYNWRLNEEIRETTGLNDISDVYNDDVYRFNADGTYVKSIGAKADDFGDLITNYCYYDLNENTLRLLMSRSENFFGTDAVDTLDITIIDDTKLYADITYYGLDAFNTGGETHPYQPVEQYEKRFVAVAKTNSFDPYKPGSEDNAGPGVCREVELDND